MGLAMMFVKAFVGVIEVWLFWVIALVKSIMLPLERRAERRALSLCHENDGRTGLTHSDFFPSTGQRRDATG